MVYPNLAIISNLMKKNFASLLLSVSAILCFSQETMLINSFISEADMDKIFIEINESGLDSSKELVWIFEFSSSDSSQLISVLTNFIQNDTRYNLGEVEYQTDFGSKYYSQYFVEFSETGTYNRETFVKRVRYLENRFLNQNLSLSGLGYYTDRSSKVEKQKVYNEVNSDGLMDNKGIFKGRIINNESKSPVPYANIGFPGKNVGTVSDLDGNFLLEIPPPMQSDTLFVTSIGFETLKVVTQSLKSQTLSLSEKITVLDEVTVVTKRNSKDILLGTKKAAKRRYGFVKGTGRGAEAAKRIVPPKGKAVYLKNAEVYVKNRLKEPFNFLVHVYDHNEQTNLPGKELLIKSLIVESDIQEGWMSVDLSSQNLVLEGTFYVSFQWVDANTQNPVISLSGKNALTRPISLGEWIYKGDFNWAIRVLGSVER